METGRMANWFDKYGESIFLYLAMMVKDYRLAEELTQKTFIKASRNLQELEGKESLETELFSMAHKEMKGDLRKKRPFQYYLGMKMNQAGSQLQFGQVDGLNHLHRQLYEAIQQLTITYGEVIVLRKIMGFSAGDTAAILNRSESKVEMMLQKGLAELKKELAKKGVPNEENLGGFLKELGADVKRVLQANEGSDKRIIQQSHIPKRLYSKKYGFAAAAFCLLLIILPFCSSVIESVILDKIPPIDPPSIIEDEEIYRVVTEKVEKEGYVVEYIGIYSEENEEKETLQIALILTDSTIQEAKEHLEPIVNNYLAETGNRKMKVHFIEVPELVTNPIYSEVIELVDQVFIRHGYAKETHYVLAELQKKGDSYVLHVNMPDHIQEPQLILADLNKALKEQQLAIEEVVVTPISITLEMKERRWQSIVSQLHNVLGWKSAYLFRGISFEIEEEKVVIWVNTDWKKHPAEEQMQRMQQAVQAYLSLQKTVKEIQGDAYTITFLLSNYQPFMEMTNEEEAE